MAAPIHIVVRLTQKNIYETEVSPLSILTAVVLLPFVVPFADPADIRTFALSCLGQSDAVELVRESLDVVCSKKR